eukprot:maker-scaffold_6-snap-gene-8.2-mRNA-1 protein AED:0.28 eAED:0.28 QI:57/1/0.5/1/1/1/2/0/871
MQRRIIKLLPGSGRKSLEIPEIGDPYNVVHTLHYEHGTMHQGNSFPRDVRSISDLNQTVEQVKHLETKVSNLIFQDKSAPFLRTKLVIVGRARVGKTSLVRSLLGEEFSEKEDSTKGCEIKISSVGGLNQSENNWKEKKDEDAFLTHLTEAVNDLKQGDGETSQEETGHQNISDVLTYVNKVRVRTEKGESEEVGFYIFDFGGQDVFYSLHHLFLTNFGCYFVVFNACKLLSDGQQDVSKELDYIEFWLNSIRTFAPNSPIFVIGTHCADLTMDELKSIDKLLKKKILNKHFYDETQHTNFNFRSCFFPVDNSNKIGIQNLRTAVEHEVLSQRYMTSQVPLSYLRLHDYLYHSGIPSFNLTRVKEIFDRFDSSGTSVHAVLEFLSARGMIIFFSTLEDDFNFVVIQPQWLIDGLTCIIFSTDEHEKPEFNKKYAADYQNYVLQGIISRRLMLSIWKRQDYNDSERDFFIQVMLATSLICPFKFTTKKEQYLLPSQPMVANELDEDDYSIYSGYFFYLDFSGDYSEDEESQEPRVNWLPIGIFEKFVCRIVEHSSSFQDSRFPKICNKKVCLSFGNKIDFLVEISKNPDEKATIKISTLQRTQLSAAQELVREVFSIVQKLKDEFLSFNSVSVDLLIPSNAETQNQLANYVKVLRLRNQGTNELIRLHKNSHISLPLASFDYWFDNSSIESNLLKPGEYEIDNVLTRAEGFYDLPENCQYHCFLSYKQADTIDIVAKLQLRLEGLGYKCWYDMSVNEVDGINVDSMIQGVQQSMVYILVLSKNIFASAYVPIEIKTAIEHEKEIILVHHPDTNSENYVSFSHYINSAPEIAKPLFENIESLPIRRRYYEEVAFLNMLKKKIERVKLHLMSEY